MRHQIVFKGATFAQFGIVDDGDHKVAKNLGS